MSSPEDVAAPPSGLRELKKRATRQLISDTATAMFLERGFDAVRVTEVAAASGVSEKTVYNYFPTKESLVLDREPAMAAAIRGTLGPDGPALPPVTAALQTLEHDRATMWAAWRSGGDARNGLNAFRRFARLIDETPALRAAQRDVMERLVRVAAEAMAERARVSPADPEPQIAATAIVGLWRIQFQSLRRHADLGESPEQVHEHVADDVRRAARLIESGLWAFGVMVQGRGSREQLAAAADAAQYAARQVATSLRRARGAWREAQHHRRGEPR